MRLLRIRSKINTVYVMMTSDDVDKTRSKARREETGGSNVSFAIETANQRGAPHGRFSLKASKLEVAGLQQVRDILGIAKGSRSGGVPYCTFIQYEAILDRGSERR